MNRLPAILLVALAMASLCFAPPIDKNRSRKEQSAHGPTNQEAPRTPEEVEALMLNALGEWADKPQFSDDPGKQMSIDDNLYEILLTFVQGAISSGSNALIEAISAFPAQSPGAIAAKANALGAIPTPVESAIPFLVQALDNPDTKVQVEASETLIRWGREWDKAIQSIYNNNNYFILRDSEDPRAADACRFGAMNGSFEGRILAATVLEQIHGDSTTIVDVAEYVVRNAPADSTDRSVGRAAYTAIRTLAKRQRFDVIEDIVRLAYGGTTLVRMESTNFLAYAASEGNTAAYDALQVISESHFDMKLRGNAHELLKNLQRGSR